MHPDGTKKIMSKARLKAALPDIVGFYEQLPDKIHCPSDISSHLFNQRSRWNISDNTGIQKFIEQLIESGHLTEIDFPFPPPYRREVRYAWGKFLIHEVMQTIKPGGYFSYQTAVKFHGLSKQQPKITYLTVEQKNSSISHGVMAQDSINRAFAGKPRTTANIAKTKDFEICIVAGRNTERLGVVEKEIENIGRVWLTDLERTLIDITVRPIYAGGVVEVAKAFSGAKDKLSVDALAAMLKKLGYTYPYHQAIGYYLERAGFKPSQLDLLRQQPMNFDFFLTHKMGETEYVKEWHLHVPKKF